MGILRRALRTFGKWTFAWFAATSFLMGASMAARGWTMGGLWFDPPAWMPAIAVAYVYFGGIAFAYGLAALACTGGARLLLGVRARQEARRVEQICARIEERAPGQLTIAEEDDAGGRVSTT